MDITLTEEEITTQSIKTNLDVIGRKGFCMEIVFKVTKHMVFILRAILRTRRKLFVFLNICSKPPVVGVLVLLRSR